MKPKIIVVVRGGLVSEFITSEDMDIILIDHDVPNDDDNKWNEFHDFELFNEKYKDTFSIKCDPDTVDYHEVNALFNQIN